MLKRFMDVRHADARMTVIILALLILVGSVSPSAFRYNPRTDTLLKKIGRTLKKRGLNREATAKATAGYYEGLLDQAAVVTQVGGRGWLDWRFWFVDRPRRAQFGGQQRRSRPDFLRYDLPPNTDIPDIDDRRRLVTNNMGLADLQYPQLPAVGTWRIALVGDSVTRGKGAEFGSTFEAMLERTLNEKFSGRPFSRYEILNFGVDGYQLTHLVDVTLARVPEFAPHAYAVVLTERSVFRVWADHIASLVHAGTDLKYDYLKEIVAKAGVTPNLSDAMINARLAPYRLSVLRWAIGEMKAQAQRSHAPLVVLLVPTPDDAEMQIEQFADVKRILGEEGVPSIDLLETFVDMDDLTPVRVSAADRHPNERGHRMLYDAIWASLDRDAQLRAIFTGTGAVAHRAPDATGPPSSPRF